MSDFERGPAHEYEITWRNGHVETVMAHQVLVPTGPSIFGGPVRSSEHRVLDGGAL